VEIVDLPLEGLKVIRPNVFGDSRGFFLETYSAKRYAAAGIDVTFVQDNHSRSVKGTLRGLHYQSEPGQAKLVRVVSGRIWDVAVDIRPRSRTFGQWYGCEIDDQKREQLFIPVGFAHGFCVLSDAADVEYKVSAPYEAATERTVSWADPELGVKWPISAPVLSARDAQAETFAALRARLGPTPGEAGGR
jgi:dTDP-4-dehydrorhamnose 3,5-epimerase